MKRLGRLLALVCAIDAGLVIGQFVRDARLRRQAPRPLTYTDCLNFMLDLQANDCLAPIADTAEEN